MPKNQPHPNEPKRARAAARPAPDPATPATKPAIEPAAGLAGLGALRDALKADAQRRERERAAAATAQREAAADADLFRREIGEVAPLAVPPRASLPRNPPPPLPVQTRLDEEAVLHEAISDEFDP